MDQHILLLKPIITEKSMKDVGKDKFTFLVAKSASKIGIKKGIEKAYGVKVKSISTITIKGQSQRAGVRRTIIKKSPYKKAIIELEKGQKIGLFDLES